MIPDVGPGETAEEIVMSKFDYAELDRPKNNVRLRLNSTVVNVEHVGDPNSSGEVIVNYINGNKAYQVEGKGVVMACYNMMIPHIVPDLPKEQDAALRRLSKVPLQYTTVGWQNWRAFKEMGIGLAMSPGNMHQVVMLDFPVNIGGHQAIRTPNDPCAIQMIGCPFDNFVGVVIRTLRSGRARALDL